MQGWHALPLVTAVRFGGNSDRFRLVGDFGDLLLSISLMRTSRSASTFLERTAFRGRFLFPESVVQPEFASALFPTTLGLKSRNFRILLSGTGLTCCSCSSVINASCCSISSSAKAHHGFSHAPQLLHPVQLVTFATTALRLLRQLG